MQYLLRTLQQLRSENDIALQLAKFVSLVPSLKFSFFNIIQVECLIIDEYILILDPLLMLQ